MNQQKRPYLLLLLLFFIGQLALGQNTTINGRFNTRHFSVNDFGSASQIYTGAVGSDGTLYFGNPQNILSYNGVEWGKVNPDKQHTNKKDEKLVKDSPVYKLFSASNEFLYVGRNNNFGYIAYSDSGVACYRTLYIAPEKMPCGQIWNIYELKTGEVIFIGENELFKVKETTVTRIPLPSGFKGFTTKTSCQIGKGILAVYHDGGTGEKRRERYLYIDNKTGKTREIKLPEHIRIRNIRGCFDVDGVWYILDIHRNIFAVHETSAGLVFNEPGQVLFPELTVFDPNYIYRHNQRLYLGTVAEGLVVADLKGKVVRKFDYYDELEDLNVFTVFHDGEDNLWMCMDNGIQYVETSNPITSFSEKEGINSVTEAMDLRSSPYLIGTHSDIFEAFRANTHTSFISHGAIKQQIFDLESFQTSQGHKTLVISYEGIYEYLADTRKVRPVSPEYAYKLRQDPDNPDVVYCTLDNGFGKMTLGKDGKWHYENVLTQEGIKTFSLVILNGKIYFGINNVGLGIYDLKKKQLRKIPIKSQDIGKESLFVEQFRGNVFVGVRDRLLVLSADDKSLSTFPSSKLLFTKNGKEDVHRLFNIDDEQLWVVSYREINEGKFEFETGWLEQRGNDWVWTQWPLAALKKAGVVNNIERSPENEIWMGATNGLYVLNFDAIRKHRNKLTVSINRFDVNGKPIRYNVAHALKVDALAYSQNSFRFSYHVNSYMSLGNMQYRHKLEGFNDDWSEWSSSTTAEFQKVGEGSYTMLIQARNAFGIESETLRYEIVILPPWYRTIWAYLLYFVGLIGLIYVVVQLSLQRVKRQNIRLEEIVQERTKEIAEQNHQLELQKEEITQKTTDILDSIQYAKRIQRTILPSQSRLEELCGDHFVLYRPKDIVSGDFYWARDVQGKTMFSAVDCTGHGVPGSLVSIVGNNGLLRAVNEFKLTEPSEILDKLREIVVNAFKSEGQSDVKDGMDIALCSIDYDSGLLKFAGANNECVIIREGELVELKPDKQPIGQFIDARPFTQKEYELKDGDCIYLYTDGYVDQFGGDKAKKFKSRPFKTMLAELFNMNMEQQYMEVQRVFDEWKGELEQVDDVCVIGVRYKKK